MSEIAHHNRSGDIRLHLLATVSIISLVTATSGAALAEEADKPLLWIELGGQLEQLGGQPNRFDPPFVAQIDTSTFTSPIAIERPPHTSEGLEGKLTFEPQNSDLSLLAAVRYGRSSSRKQVHQQTNPASATKYINIPSFGIAGTGQVSAPAKRIATTSIHNSESHFLMDFQVGKDVGLGLFGRSGKATLDVGVRFAQFTQTSQTLLTADPDFHFAYQHLSTLPPPFSVPANITFANPTWHSDAFSGDISQSFRGIGPSVGWNGNTVLVGHKDDSAVTLDWGVNAAMLFGRQKVRGQHKTDSTYRDKHFTFASFQFATHVLGSYHHSYSIDRSRFVTVPNVGGFAGISFRYSDAKVSLGYRADVFFNAIDGGIDTRHTMNRGFFGPYASVSIGVSPSNF